MEHCDLEPANVDWEAVAVGNCRSGMKQLSYWKEDSMYEIPGIEVYVLIFTNFDHGEISGSSLNWKIISCSRLC